MFKNKRISCLFISITNNTCRYDKENLKKTRIKSSIKAKLNKSDGQTNINKYKVTANLVFYNILQSFKDFSMEMFRY